MGKKLKIFVSHHHDDAKKLGGLKKQLEMYDIDCFVAHEDIKPGEHDLVRIQEELKARNIFLLIGNNKSKDSSFVNQEIGFALGQDKHIISTIKNDSSTWGFVARQQAIKYGDIEDSIFFNKLLRSIAELAEADHYLGKKQKALTTLDVENIYIGTENDWNLKTTRHDDYGFKTFCVLKKCSRNIAFISLAHSSFPDRSEPKSLRNWSFVEIKDYLPNNQFSFLDTNFFSRIQFDGETLDENQKDAIRCLFNDIETNQELKDKYAKKSVTQVSLFRDERNEYEKLLREHKNEK